MRRGTLWAGMALAVLGAALAVPAQASASWDPGPERFGIGLTRNVPVTMKDGTVLRVDVYFPTVKGTGAPAKGPFPVIMNQTPYGKLSLNFLQAGETAGSEASGLAKPLNSMIKRGYINVIADVRGTGRSQGKFDLFEPIQAQDGAELVEWAAQLPHAKPRVGLYGPSYMGINQFLTATAVGKGSPLKAMFPVIAANDPYRELFAAGGLIGTEGDIGLLGVFTALPLAMPFLDEPGSDPAETINLALLRVQALSVFAELAADVLSGGDRSYDEDWWRTRSPRYMLEKVVENRVPAFLVGGWFDVFQAGVPANYSGLQNLFSGRRQTAPMSPSQKATSRYQLLVGPWTHVLAGDHFKLEPLAHRWFDTWLKKKDTGLRESKKTVHLFDLGRDRYVDTNGYPFKPAKPTTFFLGPGGSGSGAPSQNDGSLGKGKPDQATGSDQIVHLGIDSPCGLTTDQYSLGAVQLLYRPFGFEDPCMEDDSTTQIGPGALTYTTKAFASEKRIAGPIDATILATSNRPETQLHATIEDIHPDGRSRPLTAGALLGSFRALDEEQSWFDKRGRPILPYHPYTRASAQPVPTGEVTRFDIEIFPTFATLRPGHRLRLTLSTADFPHVLPIPSQLPGLLGGVYQVQRSAAHASFLNIPLAPASKLARPCELCG